MEYFTYREHPAAPAITASLRHRGYTPVRDSEWEGHMPEGRDPHNYRVFVGQARRRNSDFRPIWVVVSLRGGAVYAIESGDPSDWWKSTELRRLATRSGRRQQLAMASEGRRWDKQAVDLVMWLDDALTRLPSVSDAALYFESYEWSLVDRVRKCAEALTTRMEELDRGATVVDAEVGRSSPSHVE